MASTLGRGSTFRVSLPRSNVVQSISPPSTERPAPVAVQRRFLVVDDELSLARAVAMLLERHGDVVVESCGESAQARLAAGEAFDVVLCDVVMPLMSGLALSSNMPFLSAPSAKIFTLRSFSVRFIKLLFRLGKNDVRCLT